MLPVYQVWSLSNVYFLSCCFYKLVWHTHTHNITIAIASFGLLRGIKTANTLHEIEHLNSLSIRKSLNKTNETNVMNAYNTNYRVKIHIWYADTDNVILYNSYKDPGPYPWGPLGKIYFQPITITVDYLKGNCSPKIKFDTLKTIQINCQYRWHAKLLMYTPFRKSPLIMEGSSIKWLNN